MAHFRVVGTKQNDPDTAWGARKNISKKNDVGYKEGTETKQKDLPVERARHRFK